MTRQIANVEVVMTSHRDQCAGGTIVIETKARRGSDVRDLCAKLTLEAPNVDDMILLTRLRHELLHGGGIEWLRNALEGDGK